MATSYVRVRVTSALCIFQEYQYALRCWLFTVVFSVGTDVVVVGNGQYVSTR